VVIASFVILMGMRLNQSIAGSQDASMANLNVQESLADVVRSVEYDFRKIGFDVPDPSTSLAIADSEHIKFYANMRRRYGAGGAALLDSVEWYVGPPQTQFPNQKVRVLYRKFDEEDAVGSAGMGVTEFGLKYFDQDGNAVPPGVPALFGKIAIIELTIRVESLYRVQDGVNADTSSFAAAYWRQTRMTSRNLRRHG
jgi:hypothetical protein